MPKKIIRRGGNQRSWDREVGWGKAPDWYLEDIVEEDEDQKRQAEQVKEILENIDDEEE